MNRVPWTSDLFLFLVQMASMEGGDCQSDWIALNHICDPRAPERRRSKKVKREDF